MYSQHPRYLRGCCMHQWNDGANRVWTLLSELFLAEIEHIQPAWGYGDPSGMKRNIYLNAWVSQSSVDVILRRSTHIFAPIKPRKADNLSWFLVAYGHKNSWVSFCILSWDVGGSYLQMMMRCKAQHTDDVVQRKDAYVIMAGSKGVRLKVCKFDITWRCSITVVED